MRMCREQSSTFWVEPKLLKIADFVGFFELCQSVKIAMTFRRLEVGRPGRVEFRRILG